MLELPVLTQHQHAKGIAIRGDFVNPAIVMLFVFSRFCQNLTYLVKLVKPIRKTPEKTDSPIVYTIINIALF